MSIFAIFKRVMALDSCENFVSAQYLKTECRIFDKILHMDRCRQALGWYCYASIGANLYQSYGL